MMKRTHALSRRNVRLGAVLGLVLIASWGCAREPNLVMEESTVGAWIPMNNTFAIPEREDQSEDTLYFWTGVLVQIGDYPRNERSHQEPTRFEFDKVTFWSGQDEPDRTLSRTDFPAGTIFWINIVSAYDLSDESFTAVAEPMTTEDVRLLYPHPLPTTHPCYGITAPEECLRTARIHEGLEDVLGVITYWQGKKGFRVSGLQEEARFGNSFSFYFEDRFRVDVYSVTDSAVTEIARYDYGAIDKIVIEAELNPPEDGEKQDPPWPGLNP